MRYLPWRAKRFRCPCAYILYSKGHMYYYYVAANKALQQDLMQIPKIAVCVSSYTFSLVLLLSFFIFLKVKTTFCGITLKKLKCISKWTQCMMIEKERMIVKISYYKWILLFHDINACSIIVEKEREKILEKTLVWYHPSWLHWFGSLTCLYDSGGSWMYVEERK